MFSIQNVVGRLVEIRFWSTITLKEAHRWVQAHDALIASMPGDYVCVVDSADLLVFSPEVAAVMSQTVRNDPRLVRTASLGGGSPTTEMQIERLHLEAQSDLRRTFRERSELYVWLAEVLDTPERQRLAEVLRVTVKTSMLPPSR